MKDNFSLIISFVLVCFFSNNASASEDLWEFTKINHYSQFTYNSGHFAIYDLTLDDSGMLVGTRTSPDGKEKYESKGDIYEKTISSFETTITYDAYIKYDYWNYNQSQYEEIYTLTSDNEGIYTREDNYTAVAVNNDNEIVTAHLLHTYKIRRISGASSEPTAKVQSSSGTSFSITSTNADVLTTSGTISDIGALLTLDKSETTIQRADGSVLEIKQNAVVTLNPESISLIRGEITASVDCNYEVRTALATITSCPTTKKSADAAKFTTNYSQSGLEGTLKVSVETGSVDVVDRNGNTITLNAGSEKTIISRVPRTQWVLPIDEDKLYGGENNFLIWTQFPAAVSYQMEFNLPTPDFAEQNTSVPQFTKQVMPLTTYTEFEGLALLTLPLPKGADGLVLELRIFALDAAGNIIGESVSSDSTKATVTD